MTIAPTIPIAMPKTVGPVERCSGGKVAITTVKTGTVAVRIPARLLSIRVRPSYRG